MRLCVLLMGAMLALTACSAVEKPYVIDMTQTNSFFPASIVVPQGSTVIWKNRDHLVHSTVFRPDMALDVSDTPSAVHGWDSGDMTSGETWEHHFDTPGSYLFICRFHEEMVGTVVVLE